MGLSARYGRAMRAPWSHDAGGVACAGLCGCGMRGMPSLGIAGICNESGPFLPQMCPLIAHLGVRATAFPPCASPVHVERPPHPPPAPTPGTATRGTHPPTPLVEGRLARPRRVPPDGAGRHRTLGQVNDTAALRAPARGAAPRPTHDAASNHPQHPQHLLRVGRVRVKRTAAAALHRRSQGREAADRRGGGAASRTWSRWAPPRQRSSKRARDTPRTNAARKETPHVRCRAPALRTHAWAPTLTEHAAARPGMRAFFALQRAPKPTVCA